MRAVVAVAVPSLLLLVVTLAGSGLVTFLPIERPLGLLAPVALLLFGATSALSRWRAGLLADRVGTGRLLPVAAVVTALGAGRGGRRAGAGPGWVRPAAAALGGAGYGAVQNLTLVAAFARVRPGRHPDRQRRVEPCFDGGTAVGAVAVGALATAQVAVASDPTGSGARAGPRGCSGSPSPCGACALLVLLAAPLGVVRGRRPAAAPSRRRRPAVSRRGRGSSAPGPRPSWTVGGRALALRGAGRAGRAGRCVLVLGAQSTGFQDDLGGAGLGGTPSEPSSV